MKNEESRLRTITVALAAFLVGIFLLLIGSSVQTEWRRSLCTELGSILIAAIALALIFDLWQKEAFFKELFSMAANATQIKQSGLAGFTPTFYEGIDWDNLFAAGTQLDIFTAYGGTWRNSHSYLLEKLIMRSDSRIRVILPDPTDDIVVAEMSARFGINEDQFRTKIDDAVKAYTSLGETNKGHLEIYHIARSTTHTFYRFTNRAVISFYHHRPGRQNVPALIVTRGGGLYEFVRNDVKGLLKEGIDKGTTRKVYPP